MRRSIAGPAASDGAEVDWAKVEKGSVRARRDADAAVAGMARDTSRRHELSDLVPPLPGMAAAPGRHDAPEPPSPASGCFVDYAGMTIPIMLGGVEHQAQVFVASMGVSGRLYAEATLSQKIDDWCASHVRCFEDMGCVPEVVVPDNIKPAVIKPSRYEPVLNETYADLLEHYDVQGFPARVKKPRDKALVENGVLQGERWILAPLRKRVFHDLPSANRAIAAQADKINSRPYADGTGENRYGRFESVDLPHMRPLPQRRWQPTVWRKNTVHRDYHIAIDYHFYSVPHELIGKEVDVRLRGNLIDVFLRGRHVASHIRSNARGRATTIEEHKPEAHQRAGVEATRAQLEKNARDIGPHAHAFVTALMKRQNNPEYGFRSLLRRAQVGQEPRAGPLRRRMQLRARTRHADIPRA